MLEWSPTDGRFVDPACPVEWAHPLNRGLVGEWAVVPNAGWWGGKTLRDLVRGGRKPSDGTLSSAVGAWVPGGAGMPWGAFDATDGVRQVDCGALPALDARPAWSMVAWMWRASTADRVVVGAASTNNYLFWYSDGNVYADVAPGGAAASANFTGWHFFVSAYGGSNVTVYVDGRQGGSGSGPATSSASPGNFHIARGGATAGRYGPVAVYDRKLSAVEVRALYDESRRGNPARWRWVPGVVYSFPEQAAGGGLTEAPSPVVAVGATVGATATLGNEQAPVAGVGSVQAPTPALVQAATPVTAVGGVVGASVLLGPAPAPVEATGGVVAATAAAINEPVPTAAPGAVPVAGTALSHATTSVVASGVVPQATGAVGGAGITETPAPVTAAGAAPTPAGSLAVLTAPVTATGAAPQADHASAFTEAPAPVTAGTAVGAVATALLAGLTPVLAAGTVGQPTVVGPVVGETTGIVLDGRGGRGVPDLVMDAPGAPDLILDGPTAA